MQGPAPREIEPCDQGHGEAVKRVLESTALSGSEMLRQMLVYLAEHTTQHPGQPAKECKNAAQRASLESCVPHAAGNNKIR